MVDCDRADPTFGARGRGRAAPKPFLLNPYITSSKIRRYQKGELIVQTVHQKRCPNTRFAGYVVVCRENKLRSLNREGALATVGLPMTSQLGLDLVIKGTSGCAKGVRMTCSLSGTIILGGVSPYSFICRAKLASVRVSYASRSI